MQRADFLLVPLGRSANDLASGFGTRVALPAVSEVLAIL
jgi:hypothetical protein